MKNVVRLLLCVCLAFFIGTRGMKASQRLAGIAAELDQVAGEEDTDQDAVSDDNDNTDAESGDADEDVSDDATGVGDDGGTDDNGDDGGGEDSD